MYIWYNFTDSNFEVLNKEILKLAIPNIISNLTVPLLGIVDLAILGHLESEVYIGAIALGGLIFNFIYWGFSFLRMGTTGMTAQAYGRKNNEEISLLFFRSTIIAIAGGIILILFQTPIEWFSFLVMDGSNEVEKLASGYFFIRIYAAPATIGLYALIGWFLGMQNARYPLIIALVVNILNIVLNYIFVFKFNMKADGVALGTVLAQYSGFILGLILFFKQYKSYLKCCRSFKKIFNISDIKKFFRINKDIFIRTVLLIFAFSFFTNQSARISDTMLAVNTILLQFFLVFSFFIDGFAYAAESLVGKYYGAGDKLNLKLVVKKLFLWGFHISIPFTLVYLILGKSFLNVFTNNNEVISETAPYLFWIAIVPLVTFAAFLWDGIYTGATATKAMRNSMIIATLIVYLPATYLLTHLMGNHGMWLALMLFMASRGISLFVFAKRNVYL
ncbi:MAG: MATE family efflux transporter [Bacteroidales bacterium]|nr:MATE family efflux transporter [Bacteroidales bacterium]